jgi:hypothetical protein
MSKARYARMKEYGKLRKEYLAKNRICEYPGCKKPAQDIHHRRGRIGRMLCESAYFSSVCRFHHIFIHENPELAREDGMLCEKGLWGKKST